MDITINDPKEISAIRRRILTIPFLDHWIDYYHNPDYDGKTTDGEI